MAHNVICTICQTKFDRDKEAFAVTGSRRYAHASCALREHTLHPETEKPQIIDPNDFVNCIYCKKTFNKSEEPFKLFTNGKYAHQACFELEQTRELTDQEKLEKYIMELFGSDYVYAKIKKQIKDYVTNHGFTYSGIHKALVYYYAIWEAQQKQEYITDAASVEQFVPKVIEIKIPAPQRQIKKKKLFSFLDEEEQS